SPSLSPSSSLPFDLPREAQQNRASRNYQATGLLLPGYAEACRLEDHFSRRIYSYLRRSRKTACFDPASRLRGGRGYGGRKDDGPCIPFHATGGKFGDFQGGAAQHPIPAHHGDRERRALSAAEILNPGSPVRRKYRDRVDTF